MKRILKKSPRVGLVLIGSLALVACEQAATQRDIYGSREDCMRDWGPKPVNCEPVRDVHSGLWRYYSPGYDYGSRPSNFGGGPSHAMSTQITRGGFGATSAMHSAGS
jgi:uncharacterized protein YgiB involved in biofilm formation